MRVLSGILLFSAVCFSDHLPENLIARGERESVLCGIDVYKSHLSDVTARFGDPSRNKSYPSTIDSGGGDDYFWKRNSVRMRVTADADKTAYGVQASGTESDGILGTTGKGLRLGQRLEDVKRTYGMRFMRKGRKVIIQWKDGTTLTIQFSSAGKINYMNLVANVE